MLRIEWVEIPGGEFIQGLPKDQKADLLLRLGETYGIDRLSSQERALLEAICQEPYEYASAEDAYFKHLFATESPLIRYWQAIRDLKKMPDARSHSTRTFYIARFPITHDQAEVWYRSSVAQQMGWGETRDKYWLVDPTLVESLDRPAQFQWEEADTLAHWLGGRLPLTTEWEKAARGPDGFLYPWGNEWNPGAGNFGTSESHMGDPEKRKGRVTAVDAYPEGASPYGVMDMIGNLSEWTAVYDDRIGVPLRMCYSIKEMPVEAQFFFALPVHQQYGADEQSRYVACRPILTEWGRRLWPGYSPDWEMVFNESSANATATNV